MMISEGEMNMNMIFRGYAMDSNGRHGGGVFLKDERECATFVFLATQSPDVHSVMITDLFDCQVAETLPKTPFLDYVHPGYRRIVDEIIPLQEGSLEAKDLDFTFLDPDDQNVIKDYLSVYRDHFGLDLFPNSQFSEAIHD